MTTAITFREPSGEAGDVTRALETTIESIFSNSAKPFLAFGLPAKYVGGKAEPFEADDNADLFKGMVVRTVPAISGNVNQAFDDGLPNPDVALALATRGYMLAICAVGTPVRGGKVFLRVETDTGKAIGDLEATEDIDVTAGAMVGTGNATAGTLSAVDPATDGDYVVEMLGATTYNFLDPLGNVIGVGATGGAETFGGVTLTVTVGGTPAVLGDTIDIAVNRKNDPLPNVEWATDGVGTNNVAELRLN